MVAKSTPFFDRAFSVFRKSPPVADGNSSSTTAATLASKLLPMLAIGSPSVAAAPDITFSDPSSRNDSGSGRFQQDVVPLLAIAVPFLEGIPVAGPPLKAVVGGLLGILQAAEVSSNVAVMS